MADNSVAAQIQVPQQPVSPLQTVLALQKAKRAFQSGPLANPVTPTAFNTDSD